MKAHVDSVVGLETNQEIDVEPIDRVEELIERIATMQAIDKNHIALFYQGKEIPKGKTLGDLGFVSGHTISVYPKAREGGSCLPPSFFTNRVSLESKKIKQNHIPLKAINPRLWQGPLQGVGQWSGRTYQIQMKLSLKYPYKAPDVRFITIPDNPLHPNINKDGSICLDLLSSRGWKTTYSMVTVYTTLQDLLRNPNYDSPVAHYQFRRVKSIGEGLRGLF